MTTSPFITALALTVSLYASQALAKPDLTSEQLAKARETAAQMKPPVDFDALLVEADRLGVECQGNFTLRPIIKTCKNKVEIAQSKERQAKLDEEIKASKERQAKLDEENVRLDDEYKATKERLIKKVNALADEAANKLKQ